MQGARQCVNAAILTAQSSRCGDRKHFSDNGGRRALNALMVEFRRLRRRQRHGRSGGGRGLPVPMARALCNRRTLGRSWRAYAVKGYATFQTVPSPRTMASFLLVRFGCLHERFSIHRRNHISPELCENSRRRYYSRRLASRDETRVFACLPAHLYFPRLPFN